VEEYADWVKGGLTGIADVRNSTVGGRGGGSITAALFLREFVGPIPPQPVDSDVDSSSTAQHPVEWAHIDMAGPVWDGPKAQATGWGVRTLTQYILNISKLQNKR
jgi:leucyl aminopeptidase